MPRPHLTISDDDLAQPLSRGGRAFKVNRTYIVYQHSGKSETLAAWCNRRGASAQRFYHVLRPWPAGTYTREFDALTDFILATERRTLTGTAAVSAERIGVLARRLFMIRRSLGCAKRPQRRNVNGT